ncbi:MAG: hypothetical protein WD749_00110 [Phycisphaerales bacterium]
MTRPLPRPEPGPVPALVGGRRIQAAPRQRLAAAAGLGLIPALLGACATMRDLAPAFEANRTNMAELSANVAALNQRLRPLVAAVWESEIEARRTAVLLELQQLGTPYRANPSDLTGARLDADLADPDKGWKPDYDRLGTALAAAAGDPAETDRIHAAHPVLSAIHLLRVSPDQAAAHARTLQESRGRVAEVRAALTNDYPYVARAVQARDESLRAIDEHSAVVDRQLRLAGAHAELFDFAATSSGNVARALGATLTDEGLQAQVLGLIRDDRSRASVAEGLTLLNGVVERRRAATAGPN